MSRPYFMFVKRSELLKALDDAKEAMKKNPSKDVVMFQTFMIQGWETALKYSSEEEFMVTYNDVFWLQIRGYSRVTL